MTPEIPGLDSVEAIKATLDRFPVCVYRHPAGPLSDEEHIAFSLRMGPIQRTRLLKISGRPAERVRHPEIIDQSNLDEYGELYPENDRYLLFKRANQLWHTDMSFHPVRATYSLLNAHALPPDGGPDTEFADMRAAYDALPAATKARIEDLVVEHSYWHSRVMGGGPEPTEEELRSRPPALHRLVHVHPRSGRKVLYLASHARRIVGMDRAEGSALLAELTELATRPQFVHAHQWRLGDLLIWDNLATMHRARPFKDTAHRRDMRRTTCREAEVS